MKQLPYGIFFNRMKTISVDAVLQTEDDRWNDNTVVASVDSG